MNNKTIKLLTIAFITFIISIILPNQVKAETWQEGKNYQFRVGDQYYTSYAEMQSMQWQYSSLNPAIVEVLQPIVEINSLAWSSATFDQAKNMVITTAISRGPDDVYQGEAGTTAKIIRGEGLLNESLFTFRAADARITFENIILDGGWGEDHTGLEATRSIISIEGNATVVLENGCTLQNNISTASNTTNGGNTNVGGAIYCASGTVIANEGSYITNCAAEYGGAITIGTGNLYTHGLTIDKCYSTGTSGHNASAIEFSQYGHTFECTGLVITNCAAINATENGPAIEMQKGTLTFCENPENPNLEIRIENNYSAAGAAGVMQYTDVVGTENVSLINIEKDLIIDNNYTNCTFNGFEVVEKGSRESNLYIDNPDSVNINTNITDATSVGVTIVETVLVNGQTVKREPDYTEDVKFANTIEGIQGISNFFSDVTLKKAELNEEGKMIFGEGAIEEEPEYTTLTVEHIDKGDYADTSIKYNYQIIYVKDGETLTQNIMLSNEERYSVEIDVNSTYTITLTDEIDETFEITAEMPEGNEEEPTIDNDEKTVTGTISVAETEGIITYTHTKNAAPNTGILDNTREFSCLFGMIMICAIIFKMISKKSIDM